MARTVRKPTTTRKKNSPRPPSRVSRRSGSTAKSVRGRNSDKKQKDISSRPSVRRRTRSSQRVSRNTRTFLSSYGSSFFVKSSLGVALFLGIVMSLFLAWYFILPLVLIHSFQSQNILYVSDDISSLEGKILFAHVGKEEAENTVFLLNGAEVVVVPNGYGEYAVGTVPQLLKIDGQSSETARSIMSRILEVPVDEIIFAPPLLSVQGGETLSGGHIAHELQVRALKSLLSDPQRALSTLRISIAAKNAADLSVASYKRTNELVNVSALKLSSEEKECSVAVINTTTERNLAGITAELLEKNGVYVVREDSGGQERRTTEIQASESTSTVCQNLAGKVKLFFPETVELGAVTTDTQRYRADIVILLGEDITESIDE